MKALTPNKTSTQIASMNVKITCIKSKTLSSSFSSHRTSIRKRSYYTIRLFTIKIKFYESNSTSIEWR